MFSLRIDFAFLYFCHLLVIFFGMNATKSLRLLMIVKLPTGIVLLRTKAHPLIWHIGASTRRCMPAYYIVSRTSSCVKPFWNLEYARVQDNILTQTQFLLRDLFLYSYWLMHSRKSTVVPVVLWVCVLHYPYAMFNVGHFRLVARIPWQLFLWRTNITIYKKNVVACSFRI